MGLQLEAITDGNLLKRYFESKGLPKEFLEHPDSVTYMPPDMNEFDEQVKKLNPEQLYLREGERISVVARVGGKVAVGTWGKLMWAEVVEPTPEDVSLEKTGLQHLDFYYPSFEAARQILKVRGVDHAIAEAEARNEIIVIYDREGREFRIADRLKDQVVESDEYRLLRAA